MNDNKYLLFSKRSFLSGFSSVFDINPTPLRNSSENGLNADVMALNHDWKSISQDYKSVKDRNDIF